ncbi:MAG: phage head closure protein [Vallitalea sp.]|jgi:SPP1 family predicted phage head-tail adaptor|nr:phage head closure protein [Vallitalea sp.]
MEVNIGELDKRIALVGESTVTTINENGFPVPTQEPKKITVWSKVSNKSGSEIFKANANYSKLITRFLIRYRKDINNRMKIKFDNKTYNIIYVNNYNYSNQFLEIIGEVIE